jgi:hypothetical protein
VNLDPLKPLAEVLIPDERWQLFSRTQEGHHALISSIRLNESVPEEVQQHFENARNAWLYSFFAYRLLTVALTTVHTACETAARARAKQENLPGWEKKSLFQLLDAAIANRWIVDSGFAAAELHEALWEDDRVMLLAIGAADIGPYIKPTDDQDHAKKIVDAVRELRNALAHGEPLLTNSISPAFRAAADLINQLFPHSAKG